jgi:hypothetical protein
LERHCADAVKSEVVRQIITNTGQSIPHVALKPLMFLPFVGLAHTQSHFRNHLFMRPRRDQAHHRSKRPLCAYFSISSQASRGHQAAGNQALPIYLPSADLTGRIQRL